MVATPRRSGHDRRWWSSRCSNDRVSKLSHLSQIRICPILRFWSYCRCLRLMHQREFPTRVVLLAPVRYCTYSRHRQATNTDLSAEIYLRFCRSIRSSVCCVPSKYEKLQLAVFREFQILLLHQNTQFFVHISNFLQI